MHNFPSYVFKIHFSIILSSTPRLLNQYYFLLSFLPKALQAFVLFPNVFHMPRPYHPPVSQCVSHTTPLSSTCLPMRVTCHAPIIHLFPNACHATPLSSTYLPMRVKCHAPIIHLFPNVCHATPLSSTRLPMHVTCHAPIIHLSPNACHIPIIHLDWIILITFGEE
jgi:hypothetical protein